MAKKVKTLIGQFKPDHYLLWLHPDKKTMTFKGTVTISGYKTGKPSQRLTFHQKDLKISSAKITHHSKGGAKQIETARINLHKKFDELRLHAPHMLYPGKYEITLEFSGKITDEMNGLYPSRFKTSTPLPESQPTHVDAAQGAGEERPEAYPHTVRTHHSQATQRGATSPSRVAGSAGKSTGAVREAVILGTQFESHHAREVFPSIDEPEAKATFDLTLVSEKGETVVSNTPVKRQETKGKLQETTFETTPKMSTYVLAFVSGKMLYKETKTKRGVSVRAYATPDNVQFTDFALDFAAKALDFYEQYFGIDYPLKKCDLIALPDFASGAMENWGCITFREQALLVDPKNTSLANKQYVAMVVAHELAHMWFGNLVTMKWWTDLWLNEGFASWIEYLAVDHIFPDWQMWTQFIVDEQQQALKLDALEHTHPVEVAINHPDEIRSIFDVISYSKGSSVIHMLHEYLGKDDFREGLALYLHTHRYGNTSTQDLWKSLEDASGKRVRKFMDKWVSEPGFPLVKATVEDGGKVNLQQTRFLINPGAKVEHKGLWPVPLLDGEQLPGTLETRTQSVDAKDVNQLKLNRSQSGFYRVVYNPSHLIHLGEAVREGKFEALDRLGLLSDLFEAAKAGQSDTVSALQFLENFSREDNYAVWDVIAGAIGSIRLVMDSEYLRETMKPFVIKITEAQVKRLGWDKKPGEPHFDQLLRPIVFSLSASADQPDVVKKCKDLFQVAHSAHDISKDINSVPGQMHARRSVFIDPDMRGTVFGTVARLGGEAEFNKLLTMHHSSTLSEERNNLSAAITNFRQPPLIAKALAQITTKEVRLQDAIYWIMYSFMNRWAKRQTWQWLKDNWSWLEKNLGNDLAFYRMPIYAARVFSDEQFIAEYQKFFEPKITPALERGYKQGLEILQWQIAWKARSLREIQHFFE